MYTTILAFFRSFCYIHITKRYKDQTPTLCNTSTLLITANVVNVLGSINSSVVKVLKITPPTINFKATSSPKDGFFPNIGFVSYIIGDFNPRYVVYTSSVLTTIKYVIMPFRLYSDCENCNSLRFAFDFNVIDLSEASFRTLSRSEL